jgi:uncharacterized protein YyaL (SSP411 family)
MLLALDFYLGPVEEFAVVGDPTKQETKEVVRLIRGGFRPNKVVALTNARQSPGPITLLADKASEDRVTTYICQNFVCQAPVVGVEALKALLAR